MVLCEHWKDWEWLRGRQIGFMGTKYSKEGKLESQAVSRIRDLQVQKPIVVVRLGIAL